MSVRDDLLARVDIVDVVGRYVQLRRTGKNRLGLCPFHKEKTPSFTVAEDKQIYKCFGCGKGGNAVNFVMEAERIDYRDAIKELARQTGFDLTPYERNPEITEKRQQDREKLKLLNKRAQEFFRAQFVGSAAETYIRDKRKLTDQTISLFGIGYAPDSYVAFLEAMKSKGFSGDDLLQAGLVSQGTQGVVPFFRHRVTFPIYDHIGNIVGFGGRALDPEQNPKYLNTTETPLYEKSHLLFGLDKAKNQIREHGFLIVVEGYMDVIALQQYGIPLGVATCGTVLTADHIKLLKRHTDQIVLLFDNDVAGGEATIRALKVAYSADVYPRAFGLPSTAKDVDEWLTAQGEQVAPELILEGSKDAFGFVVAHLVQQTDITNPVYRKKLQQQCFALLQSINDYGILLMYGEQLGTALRMTGAEIMKEFKSRLQQQKRGVSSPRLSAHKPETPETVRLISTLAEHDFWRTIADHTDVAQLMDLVARLSTLGGEALIWPEVSPEERLTLQLWREHQLDGLSPEKRPQIVVHVVQKGVHDLMRQMLKNPQLSTEQKQELLQLMK